MDVGEAILLSDRNRNDDGYCLGGGIFMWVIVLVLIFFAFGWGRNDWGNRTSNNGVDAGTLFAALGAQNRTYDLSQVERDVLTSSCGTQKEILESRFTTQLGFQNAQAQLAQCCCELKDAIAEDGEKTRALIQNNTIQALRDANEQKDRQILLYQVTAQNLNQTDTLINTLLPRSVPAYPSCSPYMANYVGLYNLASMFANNGNCGNCGNCNN